MTLRTNDSTKLYAHGVLDQVRAGVSVPVQLVCWALAVLGEPLQ